MDNQITITFDRKEDADILAVLTEDKFKEELREFIEEYFVLEHQVRKDQAKRIKILTGQLEAAEAKVQQYESLQNATETIEKLKSALNA